MSKNKAIEEKKRKKDLKLSQNRVTFKEDQKILWGKFI